jgi:hypothetical protein
MYEIGNELSIAIYINFEKVEMFNGCLGAEDLGHTTARLDNHVTVEVI